MEKKDELYLIFLSLILGGSSGAAFFLNKMLNSPEKFTNFNFYELTARAFIGAVVGLVAGLGSYYISHNNVLSFCLSGLGGWSSEAAMIYFTRKYFKND